MKKFYDSPLYHALCGIFDLIILNLLFLLCCIPVVTIGAAITALNASARSLSVGSSFSVSSFFDSFKSGFRQSTSAFFIGITGLALFLLDFWIASSKIQSPIRYLILGVVLSTVLLLLFVLSYIFPIISVSERALKENAYLSVYYSIKLIPRTIVICFLNLIPLLLFLLWPYVFMLSLVFWLLVGFALIAYVDSLLLRPMLHELWQ